MRRIGRWVHAWVIPEQVSIPRVYDAFTEDQQLKDKDIELRLKAVGQQVARYAYLHRSEHAMEFLKLWESGQLNPGGDLL